MNIPLLRVTHVIPGLFSRVLRQTSTRLTIGQFLHPEKQRAMRTDVARVMTVLVTALLMAGCETLPTPACPPPPAMTMDLGPVATSSPTTSVTIALTRIYMREKIIAQLDTPLPARASSAQLAIPEGAPGAIPTGGVSVVGVTLREGVGASASDRLMSIRVTPWLRKDVVDPADASGQTYLLSKATVPRQFELLFRLKPHLITATTVADEGRRRNILACAADDTTCEGAVISFDFVALYDQGKAVACDGSASSVPPDLVSGTVLKGVYAALATQAPLRLPTGGLVSMIASLTGTSPRLVGMSLGTDTDLKIGLLLDVGATFPFESFAAFRNLSVDWAVVIDRTLIASQIDTTLATTGARSTPPVAFSLPANVVFDASGLEVSASGRATTTAFACSVPVSVRVSIPFSACTNASGSKVLRMCPGRPTSTPTVTACAFFEQLFGIFAQPQGMAVAAVTCPTCRCVDTPIAIEAGPGDMFYITSVDTSGVFEIAGRSTFADVRIDGDPNTPGWQMRPDTVMPCP